MKKTSFLFAASLVAAPAFGQADECINATDLGTGPTTATFDTNMCSDTGTLATTSVEQQCISLSEDVWFKYTAQTTGLASFDTCNNATFDTEIGVWEGADCSTFVGLGCNDDNFGLGCSANTSFLTNIPVTAGQTYYIQLGYWSAAGGVYGTGTLTIDEFPDPCLVQVADQFEDNDDCNAAAALANGSYPGLNASITDQDFYEVTIPAGESLFVDVTHSVAIVDLDVYIWDPNTICNTAIAGEGVGIGELAVGFTGTDNENVVYANLGATPQTVVVEVQVWSGSAGQCGDYDLDVMTMLDPCTVADAYEDNDDCNTNVALADGNYPALNVQADDLDFYQLSVGAGDTLTVDATFISDEGDIDIYLWDPTIACDSQIAGEGGGNGDLAFGFSADDNENIFFTNATAGDLDLILEVRIWSGDADTCANYELDITGANGGGPGPVGIPYCDTNANSTGASGDITGFGTTNISDNDLTVTAANLPLNQFGIFIVSRTEGFVPNAGGTSNGNLCIGGAIGRYQGPGQIQNTGMTGAFSLAIDLTAIPQGGGSVAVVSGDTWHFQAWHRDTVGQNSNFTNGLEINF